jgi:hypothetical protein
VVSQFDARDSCRVETLCIDDMCAAMAQRLDVKLKRRISHLNMPVIVCVKTTIITGQTNQSFLDFFFCRPPKALPALSGVSSSSKSVATASFSDQCEANLRLRAATCVVISFSFLVDPTSETLRPFQLFALFAVRVSITVWRSSFESCSHLA